MWLKYAAHPLSIKKIGRGDQSIDKGYGTYTKPHGFWITDDSKDCWKTWCEGEGFCLEALNYKYQVELDESRILFLRSAQDIDDFSEKYGKEYKFSAEFRQMGIDWQRVAHDYDGIIITPYIWERRLGFMDNNINTDWYYPWDCASGCIWEPRAIKSLTLVNGPAWWLKLKQVVLNVRAYIGARIRHHRIRRFARIIETKRGSES